MLHATGRSKEAYENSFSFWQFFYIICPDLTFCYQYGFLVEKGTEISCDAIHNTFLWVKQTKDKGLFLCIITIFVKVTTF